MLSIGGAFCYNGAMIKLCVILLLFFAAVPLAAADLGTPDLSAPLAVSRLFDPERFLTTGGMRYAPSRRLTLEPELGVGYRSLEREIAGGVDEAHHVHAQAGGRLSLADTVYLSAAAKLPVYTFQRAGSLSGQDIGTRQGSDLGRGLRNPLNWTGEIGVRISAGTDLTLFYDQSQIPGWLSGASQQEERIGTRLIWRFK